jgi:epoxyqueuosine reductase
MESRELYIKNRALSLGFDYCGIAKAQKLDDEARRLEAWLNRGMHGSMQYMERHFDMRVDPAQLVPGARSVITVLKNYHSEKTSPPGQPRISQYAFGNDYHDVIRGRLNEFLQDLRDTFGEIQGRGFVDSAPVLERSWASRSGLGWIGRNGNLLTKQQGSFLFIATLVTDLSLLPDDPFAKDFCGTCTRCIDACPTEAILPDRVVDGSKCISYYTIELKDLLVPEEAKGKFDNWMFGCDTCQDVCPWNRFSKPNNEPGFTPIPGLLDLTKSDWEEMTEEQFRKIFKNSPLRRAKYAGIRRNLKAL